MHSRSSLHNVGRSVLFVWPGAHILGALLAVVAGSRCDSRQEVVGISFYIVVRRASCSCASWVDIEWILSGSWVDLEWILGVFRDPLKIAKNAQDPVKIHPRSRRTPKVH